MFPALGDSAATMVRGESELLVSAAGLASGSNYIPANAINELEMWQAETFDPAQIDKELGWAEGIGMNTMRVFLHDLLWQQDAVGFKNRIDRFLAIASKHHIRPVLVLFDSVWDPYPKLAHSTRQSPVCTIQDGSRVPGRRPCRILLKNGRLKAYVQGVVGAFANDSRVLAWVDLVS